MAISPTAGKAWVRSAWPSSRATTGDPRPHARREVLTRSMKVRAIGKSAVYAAIQATWSRRGPRLHHSMMTTEPFEPGCNCDYSPLDAKSACCGGGSGGSKGHGSRYVGPLRHAEDQVADVGPFERDYTARGPCGVGHQGDTTGWFAPPAVDGCGFDDCACDEDNPVGSRQVVLQEGWIPPHLQQSSDTWFRSAGDVSVLTSLTNVGCLW